MMKLDETSANMRHIEAYGVALVPSTALPSSNPLSGKRSGDCGDTSRLTPLLKFKAQVRKYCLILYCISDSFGSMKTHHASNTSCTHQSNAKEF